MTYAIIINYKSKNVVILVLKLKWFFYNFKQVKQSKYKL